MIQSFRGLGIDSPPCFVFDFLRKMFLMLYSISWQNLIVWFRLLLEILICILQLLVTRAVTWWNLKLALFFQSSRFLHDQKVKTKIQLSWEWEDPLRWNKKHFSSFKGISFTKKSSLTWECDFKAIKCSICHLHFQTQQKTLKRSQMYSKLTIKTPEWHLLFHLLLLLPFSCCILFYCYYCWIRTNKSWLGLRIHSFRQ